MEETSASDSASPDVRPVICESLLDLADWGDILDDHEKQAELEQKTSPRVEIITLEISDEEEGSLNSNDPTKANGANERERAKLKDSQTEFHKHGDSNLPAEATKPEQNHVNVFRSNGTSVGRRNKIRHSWPEVSVKLGQDVTYNCFPHSHFSFEFKEVTFDPVDPVGEDDEDDEFQVVSVAPTTPASKSSKSHKKAERSKHSHSKKKDKKTAVLTEATSQNKTPVSSQKHGESKAVRIQLGQNSSKILVGKPGSDKKHYVEKKLVIARKPGVSQDSKITAKSIGVSSPVLGGLTPAAQGLAGQTPATQRLAGQIPAAQGLIGQNPATQGRAGQIPATQGISILPKNLQVTPSVVPVQGIKIGPKVVDVSGSQKDASVRQMNIGTLLPPTPPNEPVLMPPLTQTIPSQRLQLILPSRQQVGAVPSNPVMPLTRFCSPTIRIVNPMATRLLTPPHLVVDKPVASISPLMIPDKPPNPKPEEKPLKKPEETHLKKPEEMPLKKPEEMPLKKPEETPLNLKKPFEEPLKKPVDEPSTKQAGEALKKPLQEHLKHDAASTPTASGDAPAAIGKSPPAKSNNDVTTKKDSVDEEIVVVDVEKAAVLFTDDKSVMVVEEDESVIVDEIHEPVETRQHLEESKDLKEDIKEVLTPMKRKAPSSPSSTMLKIKCEKIDAVVRINKSDDDLYRAERRPEKSTVHTRRESRAAAEQGCFFNVVEKEERLGVCPCGRANAYDAMIACDNPRCEVEWYHFSCVGVTKVPKDEWFCPFCDKEAADALRKKKERRRELRRKKRKEETRKQETRKKRVPKKVPQEEEGLCPCGQPNSWDRMIACDGKECSVEWYHFKCVDVQSAPDQEWLCILCRDSNKDTRSSPYAKRKRRYRPIKYSIYGESTDSSDEDDNDKDEAKDWDESESDSSDTSSKNQDNVGRSGGSAKRHATGRARKASRNDDESNSSDSSYEGVAKRRGPGRPRKGSRGKSPRSFGESSDDELNVSRRSRRERHKKIDLDFEDGAQFDDDDYSYFEEVSPRTRTVRTVRRRKRRRVSGETGDDDDDDDNDEEEEDDTAVPSTRGKKSPKYDNTKDHKTTTQDLADVAGDSSRQKAINPPTSSSVSGHFELQQCTACSQEFIVDPSSTLHSVLCPACANKPTAGAGDSSQHPPDTNNQASSRTDNTSNPSEGTPKAASASTSEIASSSDDAKREGDGHGSRSTRFHEIVPCKVCGMGYRTRVSLLIHMKEKHIGHLVNFECIACDKLFISQQECKYHRLSVHHLS